MADEKIFEAKLVKAVKEKGGMAIKVTSQYHRGLPDRLVLLPAGRAEWVEVKSSGKKPTKLQVLTHDRLRALGQKVSVVGTSEELEEYKKTL